MEVGQAGRYAGDAAAFGSAMNSIAHSQAMLAAVRDYAKVSGGSRCSSPAVRAQDALQLALVHVPSLLLRCSCIQ
jgi:hypothetical protein